jgi:L-lactate utilization protein LutB
MNGAEKFTKASERAKNVFRNAIKEDIDTLSATELEMFQTMIQAIDAADDVIAEQQVALQTIDEKLDKLNEMLLKNGVV